VEVDRPLLLDDIAYPEEEILGNRFLITLEKKGEYREAYEIDLGTAHEGLHVEMLRNILAKYGRQVPTATTPDAPNTEEEEKGEAKISTFTEGDKVPPVLNGTGKVNPEEAISARKALTDRVPIPSWVKDVRAECQHHINGEPCGANVAVKSRYMHSGTVHDLKVSEIKWNLVGIPEGHKEATCSHCQVNFPHPTTLYYHERNCIKKESITSS
jgi:hypothetical protein